MNPTLMTGSITNIPHDDEAERAILSASLMSPDVFPEVVTAISEDDLYLASNRAIFKAMRSLFDRSIQIEPVALMDCLRASDELESAGGMDALLSLAGDPFSIMSWRHSLEIVQRDSMLRSMLYASVEITALTQRQPDDVSEVVERAESLLLSATDKRVRSSHCTMRDVMDDLYMTLCEQAESGHDGGMSTGFAGVDSKILGLRPGQMIVIGARPGVGKTSLCLNLATNMAYDGATVALFSLEMSSEEVGQRLLSTRTGIPLTSIRSARIRQSEWQTVIEAVEELRELPILIDDTPATTVTDVRAKARRMLHNVTNGVVIIDYLQLMSGGENRRESRATIVGEMSRGIKVMAKELGVPVIALSQLNREVEGRQNRRPQLSDLRESGSIEQDADIVMLLDRSMTPEEAERKDRPNEGVTSLIIAKNRSGPLGVVNLRFDGGTTRFIEIEEVGLGFPS